MKKKIWSWKFLSGHLYRPCRKILVCYSFLKQKCRCFMFLVLKPNLNDNSTAKGNWKKERKHSSNSCKVVILNGTHFSRNLAWETLHARINLPITFMTARLHSSFCHLKHVFQQTLFKIQGRKVCLVKAPVLAVGSAATEMFRAVNTKMSFGSLRFDLCRTRKNTSVFVPKKLHLM